MVTLRKEHTMLRRRAFLSGTPREGNSVPDVSWHGIEANAPDWSETSQTIAMLLAGAYSRDEGEKEGRDLYIIFNASHISRYYSIPPAPSGGSWLLKADTALSSPGDICPSGEEIPLKENRYHVTRLSTVILISQK